MISIEFEYKIVSKVATLVVKKQINSLFLTVLTVLIMLIIVNVTANAASVNHYISAHHYSPSVKGTRKM